MKLSSINIENTELLIKEIAKDIYLFKAKGGAAFDFPKLGQYVFNLKFEGLLNVIAASDEMVLFCNAERLALLLPIIIDYEEEIQLSRKWKLPVYFEELEDWNNVISASNMEKDVYIQNLLSLETTIAMFGFIPGFCYIEGLPKAMYCARKSQPSVNRNGNVLALGGPYLGIHCLPSPTGWNVIGKIPMQILQFTSKNILPFKIGDKILIEQIDKSDYNMLLTSQETIVKYNA